MGSVAGEEAERRDLGRAIAALTHQDEAVVRERLRRLGVRRTSGRQDT